MKIDCRIERIAGRRTAGVEFYPDVGDVVPVVGDEGDRTRAGFGYTHRARVIGIEPGFDDDVHVGAVADVARRRGRVVEGDRKADDMVQFFRRRQGDRCRRLRVVDKQVRVGTLERIADRDVGFDRTGRVLERPVTALACVAGAVRRSGDVGARDLADPGKQRFTLGRRRDITAVNEQVGTFVETVSPARERVPVRLERVAIDHGVAEPDLARVAMTDQVNGIEAAVRRIGRQRRANSTDRVVRRVENLDAKHHPAAGRLRLEIANDLFVPDHRRIDEGDFLAGRRVDRAVGLRHGLFG